MAEPKDGKVLVLEGKTRDKILEGAKEAYIAVSTSYGPKGKNVILEKGVGRPIITRDGATIVRDVYFSEASKNIGAQILNEASQTANNVAGDGSSATVVLAYHLLVNAIQAIAAGQHPMEIEKTLMDDSYVLLEALEKLAIPVKDEQLKDVATVSAGDPLIGELIADAVLHVGPDGGILTEKSPITEVEREFIDGYYLQTGFTAIQQGKKELANPFVVVSSKRLSSNADAIELLTKIAQAKQLQPGQIPRVLFVGNFEDAAYNTIVENINRGTIDAIIIKTPPMYGELGKYLLEDIAIYAGTQPLTEELSLKQFGLNYIGTVDKVVANKNESTLFADNETEAVLTRIEEIKDQIDAESQAAFIEKLRDRIAKLEGKIALFRIGAANETAKEELEFRIEDSINSTRHAHAEGIVAGGGVTLLELSKLEISDIFRNALQSTFKKLLINANLPAEVKLAEALNGPKGHGYDLRKDDKLVDMVKAGIIDAVVVPREVIKNASGSISKAITVGASLIIEVNEKT